MLAPLPGSEQFNLQQRRAIETSGASRIILAVLQQIGILAAAQDPSCALTPIAPLAEAMMIRKLSARFTICVKLYLSVRTGVKVKSTTYRVLGASDEECMTEESPFACDMTAIPIERRGAHIATIEKLFRSVQSSRELPDGYEFELRNESDILLTAAEFIIDERLCCPFFDFGLRIEREGGAVWLSLTGREGVKPFIMAEVGGQLRVGIQSGKYVT